MSSTIVQIPYTKTITQLLDVTKEKKINRTNDGKFPMQQ